MASTADIIKALRSRLEEIRDEKRTYANTATRIGNALLALLSYFENAPFLRKDTPDTALEHIRFEKGFSVGTGDKGVTAEGDARLRQAVLEVLSSPDFQKGVLDGRGVGIYIDEQGKSVAEVDKLMVRLKMIIQELEVRKMSYVGGDQVHSSAGSLLSSVRKLPSGDYRCYVLADDGSTRTMNDWRIGDQARCQTFNIMEGAYQNVSNRYYWRLVVNRGEETLEDGKLYHFIDLSNTLGSLDIKGEDGKTYTCVGSDTSTENDTPKESDKVVQLGNQIDTDRQYAYIIYVTEQKRVDYAGINDFDLASHAVEKHSADGGFVHSDRFEIRSASGTGVSAPIVCDRGPWLTGMICGHYDRVSHNGSLWLCNVGKGKTTSVEPTEWSTDWIKQVEKGDYPIELDIYTDNGNFIRNSQGTITLTAVVTRNGEDITDLYRPQDFSWTRQSGNPEYDTEWNNRHKGVGNIITITAEDVFRKAVFDCTLCPP